MSESPVSEQQATTEDVAAEDVAAEDVAAEDVAAEDVAAEDVAAGEEDLADLEHEGDVAADYLEELLDIADLDGDIDLDVEGDRASVSISGGELSVLVGRNGEVLDALQELTRLAVYQETGRRSWLMLDVGGFRARRRAEIEQIARDAVARVQETGNPEHLRPMNAFERKVAHDAVASAGLTSESEGVEPERHVVVLPR